MSVRFAEAIASRTIQWEKIEADTYQGAPSAAPRSFEKLAAVASDALGKVTAISTQLMDVLDTVRRTNPPNWDPIAIRQLEWSVRNAVGDLHLYIAVQYTELLGRAAEGNPDEHVSFHSLILRANVRIDSPSALAAPTRAQLDRSYGDALDAFIKCEMLFPPGVETLTNPGTLYLYRSQSGDLERARDYLERAISLNRNYEYANLRLVQAWEMELARDRVISVLKRYPRPPRIPQVRSPIA